MTEMRQAKPEDDDAAEEGFAEEVIDSSSETALHEKLEEAEARRLEAERQVADLNDRFRKAQQQMHSENNELRLRLQRNFDQKLEKAKADLVAGLLDSLDNLKRAVSVAAGPEGQKDPAALLDGIRATAELFESQLKSMGLTKVESLGEPFNPEVHEAVEIVPATEDDHERVVDELQVGYKVGDRLIRPARVKVGRKTEGQ